MAWGRYESSFVKHPKVQAVPRAQRAHAIALHMAATLYCAELLTDGFVPTGVIPRLAAEAGVRGHQKLVFALRNVGLFDAVDGGIRVHDYLVYNPSASEVKEKRRLAAERQARHRSQTKLDVTQNVTRDVTAKVTRDSLARADAPAHARGRPVPSLEPLGDRDGEGPPAEPEALPAPPPDEFRQLAERDTDDHEPEEDLTPAELEEREQAHAAAQRRLAAVTSGDEDIPLR